MGDLVRIGEPLSAQLSHDDKLYRELKSIESSDRERPGLALGAPGVAAWT